MAVKKNLDLVEYINSQEERMMNLIYKSRMKEGIPGWDEEF